MDDEDLIREVAELSLSTVGGWEVFTAASGSEAVTRAEETRPDAILLDVMMPDLDGPSTLARLRWGAATRDVPVVFLTAKVQPREVARLHELGAAGVIAKPFDPMLLPDQVAEVLGWET